REIAATSDGDVKVPFLDNGRLKSSGEGAEHVHDLPADPAVQLEMRRHEHGLRTTPRRLDARHRRSDAEPAGLVARGQDNSTAMLSRIGSDDDGFPFERWILADLDGRVEGIHVHMDDDPRTRRWRGHSSPHGPGGRSKPSEERSARTGPCLHSESEE